MCYLIVWFHVFQWRRQFDTDDLHYPVAHFQVDDRTYQPVFILSISSFKLFTSPTIHQKLLTISTNAFRSLPLLCPVWCDVWRSNQIHSRSHECRNDRVRAVAPTFAYIRRSDERCGRSASPISKTTLCRCCLFRTKGPCSRGHNKWQHMYSPLELYCRADASLCSKGWTPQMFN